MKIHDTAAPCTTSSCARPKICPSNMFFLLCVAIGGYATTSWFLFNASIPMKEMELHMSSRASKKTCKCIDCDEDELCGGLWRAERFPPPPTGIAKYMDPKGRRIHIVVSHCLENIDWIERYTAGLNVASMHIVSKCEEVPPYIPQGATHEMMENIGRCDHTYAYYVSQVLDTKLSSTIDDDNSIVVFLKDNHNLHQGTVRFLSSRDLVNIASSSNGFGCAIARAKYDRYHSPYHYWRGLSTFQLEEYESQGDYDESDRAPFESPSFKSMGSFTKALNPGDYHVSEVVPVCYGGIFAASVANIKAVDASIWKRATKLLSRGDNILEGHFMERSWAMLLSTPLKAYHIDALRKCTTDIDDWITAGQLQNYDISPQCHGERGARLYEEVERKTGDKYDKMEWEMLPTVIKEMFELLGYDETNWEPDYDDDS
ncbi:hypothetical protein ACHAWF_006290 [Thalassiosira exigua]